jgi:hypothetical protein
MLEYLKHIEGFIRDQHFGHKIWNISVTAPYSQNGRDEGLIEVAYSDDAWHKKTYVFVYNEQEVPNADMYEMLYKQGDLIIFEEK